MKKLLSVTFFCLTVHLLFAQTPLGAPNGIKLGGFPANTNYYSNNQFILFGDPGKSEDFIGYKNHTFYFMDSDGGGDTGNPNVVIGNRLSIGTTTLSHRLRVEGSSLLKGDVHFDISNWFSFERSSHPSFSDTKIRMSISGDGGLPGLRVLGSSDGGTNYSDILFLQEDGNVGIGVTGPSDRLEVQGAGFFHGRMKVGGSDLQLGIDGGRSVGSVGHQRALVHYTEDRLYINFEGDFEGGTVVEGGKMIIKGKTGIGTYDLGSHQLAVGGSIRAEEIKVESFTGGPDYVFDEDYQLSSLVEIEAYISENKHLPEVPSAREMEEDGFELAQMNMLLLKKIEELTLHLIDQNKRLEEQNEELNQLKKKVQKLEDQ